MHARVRMPRCIPHSDIIVIAGVPIHHNPALLRQIKPHLATNKKVSWLVRMCVIVLSPDDRTLNCCVIIPILSWPPILS